MTTLIPSKPLMMQGILSFSGNGPQQGRRKAMRACQRCKNMKKRCTKASSSFRRCQRCRQDGRFCSFDQDPLPASAGSDSLTTYQPSQPFSRNSQSTTAHGSPPVAGVRESLQISPVTEDSASVWSYPAGTARPLSQVIHDGDHGQAGSNRTSHADDAGSDGSRCVPSVSDSQTSPPSTAPPEMGKELRYVNMLHMLESRTSNSKPRSSDSSFKLISGTNPLSALLRKELKHKIVTNTCSFRTPDPAAVVPRHISRPATGVHGCDWEAQYRSKGVSTPRMAYLRAIGCFSLPPLDRCSHLLETFFTRVYPLLPIIDRREFLARYYGLEEPPPLVVLQAIFLAASRYADDTSPPDGDGPPEIRMHCDALHEKVHALIEADICSERIAVIQAALLASLHWEGREGLNSAIDNLSLAVRACQEMGLHRKTTSSDDASASGNRTLLRRIWWSVFALDRLNAAQEGTPFLINENDCDVDMLNDDDLGGEDMLTCQVAALNLSLAFLIQYAVRSLYGPRDDDHTTLFSERGFNARQRLVGELDKLAERMRTQLLPVADVDESDRACDMQDLWYAILLSHLDAVRILVHRPFITYAEPDRSGYASRNACRVHALDLVSRLNVLKSRSLLRYSWPFTVYAAVNCLLIFWYDISSPATDCPSIPTKSRADYAAVVNLLWEMGRTWWAAAAKHKLAEALVHAVDELHARESRLLPTAHSQNGTAANRPQAHANGGLPISTEKVQMHGYLPPLTPFSVPCSRGENNMELDQWPADMVTSENDGSDFWTSIGLNFDMDVAGNIFSLLPTDNVMVTHV